MVLSVPVNAASEVPALAAAGAGELYCGLQERWWVERYGDHDSMSRRQGRANLGSREELAQAVDAARAYDLPLYLALNGLYDEHQLDYLVELADAFQKMGGTGLIVRDLGLLSRLKRSGNGLRRVCSLLAACANAQSVLAYAAFGVSRVVFPRFLQAGDVQAILRACGQRDMEAESMVFFDKCPLVDGYCTHYHGVSYPDRMGSDAQLDATPLYTFDTTYRTHACLRGSCAYVEPYPCAACQMESLKSAGVGFGKIGGRGRPLAERVRAIRFLRAAERMSSDQMRAQYYAETFRTPCACYYGQATQRRTSIEPVSVPISDARWYVGDVRDGSKLRVSLCDVLSRGRARLDEDERDRAITVLMGPLPHDELDTRRWQETLELMCQSLRAMRPSSVHLCANDVGTLAVLGCERARVEASLDMDKCALKVTAGPLLTRGDKPAEFPHFLRPEENPPRQVWDIDGNPRILTYRSIADGVRQTDEGLASAYSPYLLWDHWNRQMRYGMRTSYRQALAQIAGCEVPPEFDDAACP